MADILEHDRLHSVLLFLHLQNDVVNARGEFGRERQNDRYRLALRNSVRALTAARAWNMDTVHVGIAFSEDYHEMNPHMPLMTAIRDRKALKRETWGAAFIDSMAPHSAETVIYNSGMSAFVGGALSELCAQRGWTTLVLCGVSTNGVVESTARQAADAGFRVITISDACASASEEIDRVSLDLLANIGQVEPIISLETALRNARALTTKSRR